MTEDKDKTIRDLLDVIEFCEGALVDAFAAEDGLDGSAAEAVAKMASNELVKNGRVSIMAGIKKRLPIGPPESHTR